MSKEKSSREQPEWKDDSNLSHMVKSWYNVKVLTHFRSHILYVLWFVWATLVKVKTFDEEFKPLLLPSYG